MKFIAFLLGLFLTILLPIISVGFLLYSYCQFVIWGVDVLNNGFAWNTIPYLWIVINILCNLFASRKKGLLFSILELPISLLSCFLISLAIVGKWYYLCGVVILNLLIYLIIYLKKKFSNRKPSLSKEEKLFIEDLTSIRFKLDLTEHCIQKLWENLGTFSHNFNNVSSEERLKDLSDKKYSKYLNVFGLPRIISNNDGGIVCSWNLDFVFNQDYYLDGVQTKEACEMLKTAFNNWKEEEQGGKNLNTPFEYKLVFSNGKIIYYPIFDIGKYTYHMSFYILRKSFMKLVEGKYGFDGFTLTNTDKLKQEFEEKEVKLVNYSTIEKVYETVEEKYDNILNELYLIWEDMFKRSRLYGIYGFSLAGDKDCKEEKDFKPDKFGDLKLFKSEGDKTIYRAYYNTDFYFDSLEKKYAKIIHHNTVRDILKTAVDNFEKNYVDIENDLYSYMGSKIDMNDFYIDIIFKNNILKEYSLPHYISAAMENLIYMFEISIFDYEKDSDFESLKDKFRNKINENRDIIHKEVSDSYYNN